MLVYRDARTRASANELVRQLERRLENLETENREDALLAALLCAGELECALCDVGSSQARSAASLTDLLASAACRARTSRVALFRACRRLLSSIDHSGEVTVTRPEGFAYYALHPLDFADLVSHVRVQTPCACVVGIRSIGTTLSAVVAAKLNAEGIAASRTTVRPAGNPYDRRTSFNPEQRHRIHQALSRGALFLVCDEGPGRSGSSFLSMAEALEAEGVSRDRILLLCAHRPDPDGLCAPDAARRWCRYHSVAAGVTRRLPQQTGDYLGADEWRKLFIPREREWPAAWPQTGRLKFLSRDRQSLLKFEGHGAYGEQVRARERLLAADEFGPAYLGHEAGFGVQEIVEGSLPILGEPSAALLRHVARYCAWRATALPATVSQESVDQLEHMAAFNLEEEFGFASELHLEVERPAVCDGRMHPYEWRELTDQRWIKLDASTHGDDHFFPGPTDIAWDLAGFSVEWQLETGAREFLLSEYRRLSGDRAAARLQSYEVAYAAFRLGWSRMAAASVPGTEDECRLFADTERYRALLDRVLLANSLPR